jgi:hypothetical protein
MSETLPDSLLLAIVRATSDEAEQLRLARHWQRTLPELEDAAERIRRSVREARCACELSADSLPDGRCPRCFGRAVS